MYSPLILLILIATISLAAEPDPSLRDGKYSIVINAENKTDPQSLDATVLLKQLYLKMKPKWPQGMKAEPIARPPDREEQIALTQTILGMTETELANYWLRLKQRTGQTPPRSVVSETTLFKLISKHKGAFSIVDNTMLEHLPKNVAIFTEIAINSSDLDTNSNYSKSKSREKKSIPSH